MPKMNFDYINIIIINILALCLSFFYDKIDFGVILNINNTWTIYYDKHESNTINCIEEEQIKRFVKINAFYRER